MFIIIIKNNIKSNLPGDWNAYKASRNQANNHIRSAKEMYYQSKFSENRNNPKGLWRIIKNHI